MHQYHDIWALFVSRVPQLTCIWMSRSKWVGEGDYFLLTLKWICKNLILSQNLSNWVNFILLSKLCKKRRCFLRKFTHLANLICVVCLQVKSTKKHILRPIEKDAMSQRQPDIEQRINSRQLLTVWLTATSWSFMPWCNISKCRWNVYMRHII